MQFHDLITRLSTGYVFAKLQAVCKDFRVTSASNYCTRTDHRKLHIIRRDPHSAMPAVGLIMKSTRRVRRFDGLKTDMSNDYIKYEMWKSDKTTGMRANYCGPLLTFCCMSLDGCTIYDRDLVQRYSDGSFIHSMRTPRIWYSKGTYFEQSGYKIDRDYWKLVKP